MKEIIPAKQRMRLRLKMTIRKNRSWQSNRISWQLRIKMMHNQVKNLHQVFEVRLTSLFLTVITMKMNCKMKRA